MVARRRRKKKNLNNGTVNSNTNINPKPPPKIIRPKLKKSFINEEHEVKLALQQRSKTTSVNLSIQHEKEVAFFTEQIALLEPIEKPDNISPAPSSADRKLDEANRTQLASSFVQIENESVLEQWKQPEKLKDASDLLFYPSDKVKDDEEKSLNHTNEPEQGLYKPPTAKCVDKNKARLINRILEDGSDEIWFKDGSLTMDLNNFSSDSTRYRSSCDRVFAVKRFEMDTTCKDIPANKILKIHFSEIVFHNRRKIHHLDEQQSLEKNIEQMYGQYSDLKNSHIVEALQSRLESIRKIIATDSVDDRSSRQYRFDLQDIRNQLHREKERQKDLVKAILKHWKSLKDLKDDDSYRKERIKLVIKTGSTEMSKEKWESLFNQELNEVFEETMEQYYDEKDKQHKNGVADEVKKSIKKPHVDDIQKSLWHKYLNTLGKPGEPQIHIELQKMENYTEVKTDNVGQYSVQLQIDGEKVTSVKADVLTTDRVKLNSVLCVELATVQPKNIILHV